MLHVLLLSQVLYAFYIVWLSTGCAVSSIGMVENYQQVCYNGKALDSNLGGAWIESRTLAQYFHDFCYRLLSNPWNIRYVYIYTQFTAFQLPQYNK
jgi:hypothetical protein